MRPALLSSALAVWLLGSAANALGAPVERSLPPDPYRLLGVRSTAAPQLDATPICLPVEPDQLESITRGLLQWDAPSALERLQDMRGREQPLSSRDLRVLEAVLKARAAHDDEGAAAKALRRLIREGASHDVLACAQLELARLYLHAGMLPELRTAVLRALRLFEGAELPALIQDSARFYQAEAFYRAGSLEEAGRYYTELVVRGSSTAGAARLRLADMAYVAGAGLAELDAVRRLLDEAQALGSEASAWGPRIAEWELERGDLDEAERWLERAAADATGSAEEQAAAGVRRADLLYLRGEAEQASGLLGKVSDAAPTGAIRQLALARMLDWDRTIAGEAMRQLVRAGRSENHRIATYARGLLANRLIARGDYARALDLLVRLVHENSEDWLLPELGDDFDGLLAGLAETAACEDLMAAMAGRASLLLRHATLPEPFLRLGDCYLELGMARPALDSYRSVAKRFGPTMIARVTLRTAKAELQVGRIASARAAAAASIARDPDSSEWRLLYAEILLEEAEPKQALAVLAPLFSAGVSISRDLSAALQLASRASQGHAPTKALRRELHTALLAAARSTENGGWPAESALQIADLHREAGELVLARELVAAAAAELPDGLLRSRAIYWQGVLAESPHDAREIWLLARGSDDPWARLAANEIALADRRPSIGRSRDLSSASRRTRLADAASSRTRRGDAP